ncbi:hypothetical protein L6Q96_08880 [Candidatus Binatia bacterium]|nr:hypothetical protein [Candidatus Binatia bacterium]
MIRRGFPDRRQRGHQHLVAAAAGLVVMVMAAGEPVRGDGPVLPLPEHDREQLSRFLGPGVVGAALPCDPIGDPTTWFPLHARASKFQWTSGPNAGRTEVLALREAKRPIGTQAWRFGLSPVLAGFIVRDAQGGLAMPAVTDTAEGLVIVANPANPFLPANLQPGETRRVDNRIAANYLDDPYDTDYAGRMAGEFTYVGTYRVTVPAGTFPAVLTRLHATGKVGPAHVEDTSWALYAPGVGMVAMVAQEDVAAFWIFHLDTTAGKVLVAQ